MAHLFYDHLIDWELLTQALTQIEDDHETLEEMYDLIETSVHTEVLIVILETIPAEHHEEFLRRFHEAPYDLSHLQYIQERAVTPIEIQIRTRSTDLIASFIADLLLDADGGEPRLSQ